MDYIFSQWDKIVVAIKKAEHVLLVLDYDGTLTPIVENPERAELDENTKSQLQSLAQAPYFTIGIISGRSLFDIKKRVALENISYAGNHGLEIEMPNMKFTATKAKELRPSMLLIKENPPPVITQCRFFVLLRTAKNLSGGDALHVEPISCLAYA